MSRLRHDELNQMEPLPASYQMVELPAEDAKTSPLSQEPAPPRPDAVVKAITPAQPAPVMEPKLQTVVETPGPSLIDKIFAWFRPKPDPQPEPEKAAVPARAPNVEGGGTATAGGMSVESAATAIVNASQRDRRKRSVHSSHPKRRRSGPGCRGPIAPIGPTERNAATGRSAESVPRGTALMELTT